MHVFIVILVALVMKNDLELETMQEGAYDWILFLSFILLVPMAFFATIVSKVRFVMRSLRDVGTDDARDKRRRAFDLHVLGLGSEEDKADLRRYVEGWLVKKKYAAFLSHYKGEAAAEARILKSELMRGLRVQDEQVFLDSDNLTDLRELLDHVKDSDVVVLMLTDAVLSRAWCLAELDTAVRANIPIVVLQVSGTSDGTRVLLPLSTFELTRHCVHHQINNSYKKSPEHIQAVLADLPQYLSEKNPDALGQLNVIHMDPTKLGGVILPAIDIRDSLTFDPNQSMSMLRSSVSHLAAVMCERACPENTQLLSFLDLTKVEPDPWVFARPIAVCIVFAETTSSMPHEQATKVKEWLCARKGLDDSQVVLCTDSRDISMKNDVDSVMLIQTKQAIEEPSCLALLYKACVAGVPIVPVVLSSSSAKHASLVYNFEAAAPWLRGLEANLDSTARTALEAATSASIHLPCGYRQRL